MMLALHVNSWRETRFKWLDKWFNEKVLKGAWWEGGIVGEL